MTKPPPEANSNAEIRFTVGEYERALATYSNPDEMRARVESLISRIKKARIADIEAMRNQSHD